MTLKNYGKVRSTVQPEAIKIDEYSVWKCTNIQPIEEDIDENTTFVGYEYDLVQYDKDEYILLSEETNNLINIMLGVTE